MLSEMNRLERCAQARAYVLVRISGSTIFVLFLHRFFRSCPDCFAAALRAMSDAGYGLMCLRHAPCAYDRPRVKLSTLRLQAGSIYSYLNGPAVTGRSSQACGEGCRIVLVISLVLSDGLVLRAHRYSLYLSLYS